MKTTASILAVTALTIVSAYEINRAISGVTWGPQRIDVFGGVDDDIWHKYYTPAGWEPAGKLELFKNAKPYSPVSVTSWASNRLDFFFIDANDDVRHKFWTGYDWQPQGEAYENLGSGPAGPLAVNSWGEGRIDLVGWTFDTHYVHKAWTGSSWYPGVDTWEDLGGDFASVPTIVSSASGRLDIFGINNSGNISHKFWNQNEWIPGGDEWEDLGGTPSGFSGRPYASSPYPGRVDIWAIDNDKGTLHHLFWNQDHWQGWEDLGGSFSTAPHIAHWSPSRIDILGRATKDLNNSYLYKFWDGYQWNGWFDKGGSWLTNPEMVTLGENNLNLLGVDKDGNLKLQVWDGTRWLPDSQGWYVLGNIGKEGASASVDDDDDEDAVASDDCLSQGKSESTAEAKFKIPEAVQQTLGLKKGKGNTHA